MPTHQEVDGEQWQYAQKRRNGSPLRFLEILALMQFVYWYQMQIDQRKWRALTWRMPLLLLVSQAHADAAWQLCVLRFPAFWLVAGNLAVPVGPGPFLFFPLFGGVPSIPLIEPHRKIPKKQGKRGHIVGEWPAFWPAPLPWSWRPVLPARLWHWEIPPQGYCYPQLRLGWQILLSHCY